MRSLGCVLVFLALAQVINLTAAFFITFLIVMLIMGIDSRVSIILFIFCLAACPVLLAVNSNNRASQMAVWSFYFLAIGLFIQVVRYGKEKWAVSRLEDRMDERLIDEDETSESFMTGVKAVDQAMAFLKENLFSAIGYMIIATFAGNFINYLFNVTSGRLLGRDAYGEFAALLSILMILTVPINSLQAMVAKMVAQFHFVDDQASIREIVVSCLKICIIAAGAAVLIFLVLSRPIAGFLHISQVTPVIVCGLTIAITLLAPVFSGAIQGFQMFIMLGSLFLAYAAVRFVFGWVFIKLGWGVSGAILGGTVSSILMIVVSAFVIRGVFLQERQAKKTRLRGIGRSYLPFILSNGILILLVSLDLVIVKRKFPSSIAGDYACAAFIGKIILYFPSSVGIVIFPKLVEAHVAGEDTRGLLSKGILIVFAGSLLLSAIFLSFPRFTITLLYGAEFIGATSILWIICLAMSGYTVVSILIYYFLATEENRFLLVSLTTCAVLGITAMYIFASTSFQVALFQFFASILFIGASFLRLGGRIFGRRESVADKETPAL